MLDIINDQNYYSPLTNKTTMQPIHTFHSINTVCQSLIDEHIPYHLFRLIWDELDAHDKIIYNDEVHDDEVANLYTEFVSKGSNKYDRKKNKKKTKLRKSVRYKICDENVIF